MVREQMGVKNIIVQIKKKKWTWAENVAPKQDNCWPIRITDWIPIPRGSKQVRGRQS